MSSLIANIFAAVFYWYQGKSREKILPISFSNVFKQGALLILSLVLSYLALNISESYLHFSFFLSYILGCGIFVVLFGLGLVILKIITSEDLDLIEQLNFPIPLKKYIFKVLRFFFK